MNAQCSAPVATAASSASVSPSSRRQRDRGMAARERADRAHDPAARERVDEADRERPGDEPAQRGDRLLGRAATWASAARACGSSASPAGVSGTERRSRRKTRSPSSASSRRICWLTAGWAIRSRSAARVKCASSATATK